MINHLYVETNSLMNVCKEKCLCFKKKLRRSNTGEIEVPKFGHVMKVILLNLNDECLYLRWSKFYDWMMNVRRVSLIMSLNANSETCLIHGCYPQLCKSAHEQIIANKYISMKI